MGSHRMLAGAVSEGSVSMSVITQPTFRSPSPAAIASASFPLASSSNSIPVVSRNRAPLRQGKQDS
jgi:hypothetical protein